MYVSKNFMDRLLPALVKRDFIFIFEKKFRGTKAPNKYRVTSKTNRLIEKLWQILHS